MTWALSIFIYASFLGLGWGMARVLASRDRRIEELCEAARTLNHQLEEARAMARRPLTEEQLAASIAGDRVTCPRCGSEDVFDDAREIRPPSGQRFQPMGCNDCHESWRVEYRAVRAEPGDA